MSVYVALENAVATGDVPSRAVLRDLLEQQGENLRRFPWRLAATDSPPTDGTEFMTMEIIVPNGGGQLRCKIDFLLDIVRRRDSSTGPIWRRGRLPGGVLEMGARDLARRHWMPMGEWASAFSGRHAWRDARRDRVVVLLRDGLSYPIPQTAWFTGERWEGPSGPIDCERFDRGHPATWCELLEFLPD